MAGRGQLRDPATGIFSAAYFDDQVRRLLTHRRYYGSPFAVALIGCDNVDAGRGAYDALVRRMALETREVDVLCRLDNETLGLVMRDVDEGFAVELAERLRLIAGETTVSIGVASAEDADVIARAAAALRAAHRLGGNQVRRRADDAVLCSDGPLDDERIELLSAFAVTVDRRENAGGAESPRVAALAEALATKLQLGPAVREHVRLGGLLHDLGKVCVPEYILRKAEDLDPDEWRFVKAHPMSGAALIASMPAVSRVAPAVNSHHERWDGGGYPRSIVGARIPVEARIVAVADAYVAMRSPRTRRDALERERAKAAIVADGGQRFDPAIVRAFIALDDEGTLDAIVEPQESAIAN